MNPLKNKHISVRTRAAPSPTGYLHVGTARIALMNYLFAKKHGGQFLLRFEDTDKARSKREFEDAILDDLAWLRLRHDGTPLRQSDRTEIYKSGLGKLIGEDKAYRSKEVREGEGEREVIRFRNPGKTITFEDQIRGPITMETIDLGDFIIARSQDDPLYHFAVVVDDHESGITHIIRGEDHISNTPRQILLQEALGYERPLYAHVPLILDDSRAKISKRKGGATIREYRDQGYLPEAIVNHLVLLGWSPDDDREFFTLKELVTEFDLSRVHKGSGIFKRDKLNSINRHYVQMLPVETALDHIESYLSNDTKDLSGYNRESLRRIAPLILERIDAFGDVRELERSGDLAYFFERPLYDTAILMPKECKNKDQKRIAEILSELSRLIQDLSIFSASTVKDAVWDFATREGRGLVLWPMRVALSGKEKSPDPFLLSEAFGKEETLARLEDAKKRLLN